MSECSGSTGFVWKTVSEPCDSAQTVDITLKTDRE